MDRGWLPERGRRCEHPVLLADLRGGEREWAALGVPAHSPAIAGMDDRPAQLANTLQCRGQVGDGEVRQAGGVARARPTLVDSEAQPVGVGLPPRSGHGGPRREGDAENSVPEPSGAIGIVSRKLNQWRAHERSMASAPTLRWRCRSHRRKPPSPKRFQRLRRGPYVAVPAGTWRRIARVDPRPAGVGRARGPASCGCAACRAACPLGRSRSQTLG
jgi:hypothetical protein